MMQQRAQFIAKRNIQDSIRMVLESIQHQLSIVVQPPPPSKKEMLQKPPTTTTTIPPPDVIVCLQEFCNIWKHRLIQQGYDQVDVNEWLECWNNNGVLDDHIISNDTTTNDGENENENATNESTTTIQRHSTSISNTNNNNNVDTSLSPNRIVEICDHHPSSQITTNTTTTAWGKLRHLCRRYDLLSSEEYTIINTETSTTGRNTTIRDAIDQIDRYGTQNASYWFYDQYPIIQQYVNEQLDLRFQYSTTTTTKNSTMQLPQQQSSIHTTLVLDPKNPDISNHHNHNHNANGNDDHDAEEKEQEKEAKLRQLLLVDRKRKSAHRKKLVWDISTQQYYTKDPPILSHHHHPNQRRRITLRPSSHSLELSHDVNDTTSSNCSHAPNNGNIITLPDVPRLPYNDVDWNSSNGTLDWKSNMDRIYGSEDRCHQQWWVRCIHPSPSTLAVELEASTVTIDGNNKIFSSLLIGSIGNIGQFHDFIQAPAPSTSYTTIDPDESHYYGNSRIFRQRQRKAIRTRLGRHIPIRISDDIQGRVNGSSGNHQNKSSKPWSKILRTIYISPTNNSVRKNNNMAYSTSTTTTVGMIDASISDEVTIEHQQEDQYYNHPCPNVSTPIRVEPKPQYWFDLDIGYCVLEYVNEMGIRTAYAFSNMELSLSDD
jgi:hypothetical protein